MKLIKIENNRSRPTAIPVTHKGLHPGNPNQGWVKGNGIYRPQNGIANLGQHPLSLPKVLER